ncbi:MAG: PAS domain-containing sensor histidine kinase [Limisphaerales bacterium]
MAVPPDNWPLSGGISIDLVGILNALEIPIIMIGMDCKVTRFNQSAADALGLDLSDIGLLPPKIQRLCEPEDIAILFAEVMAEGLSLQREIRYADRWFILRVAPYKGNSRQIEGAVLAFTNITALREELAQAIYEREYTKMILNTVIQPLVVLDSDLRVLTGNRAFYSMFGVSREKSTGAPLRDLGNHEWNALPLWTQIKTNLSESTEFETVEVRADFPGIGRRAVLIDAHRLPRGDRANILVVLLDITDRKEAEQRIAESLDREKAAREQAETAARAKDDFLAVLSHELRTPLNPVLLVASDSAENPELAPDIRAQFETILTNVEIEAKLIDDLLDLTRIRTGKLNLDLQTVDAHAVLTRAFDTVKADIAAKQIQVVSNLNAGQCRVSADAVRLQQVFWNVLRNAVKFTPKAGRITVETFSTPEPRRLHVVIKDTGIGMTPEELAHMFSAFSQGEHNKDNPALYGGLGLGLAISKRLVELHSGTIRAFSDGRDLGSKFIIELPLANNP